jgi:hypothetical protein
MRSWGRGIAGRLRDVVIHTVGQGATEMGE